jgi:MATE family multidrug resistance protein
MEDTSKISQTNIYRYPPGSYRQVILLAYPVVLTMIGQTMIGLLSTMMIGRVGTAQLGAAGLAGMMTWMFLSFFNGIISSAATFVAQDYGAEKYDDIGKTLWQYLYIAVFSYVILIIVASFSGPILRLIGSSKEVESYSLTYIRIQLYFSIGTFINFSVIGFFRGISDTKTPLYITIGVSAFNIALNYALIFGKFGLPRLEVTGVALGNALSVLLGSFLYIGICLSGKNKSFHTRVFYPVDFNMIRRIIRVGFPLGFQFFLDNASFSIFSAFIARMGNAELAASNAAMTLMSSSFMPLFGFSVAATALVGKFIGAKEMDHAIKSGYTAIKLGTICAALMTVGFMVFPVQLMKMISKDPAVISIGSKLLPIAGISRLSDGFGSCSGGALRGAGDTKFPMFVGLTYAWLVFVPWSYLLGYTFKFGVVGSWVAATVYIVLYGVTVFLRFQRGKWRNIKI